MKIYFCDNLAESQVEDSLNVIFVATFSFMIFYSFFYDLLVEIVFLWSLWFFGCPSCGNDFYDFLLQSLVILMIFMILMILNFLFITFCEIVKFRKVPSTSLSVTLLQWLVGWWWGAVIKVARFTSVLLVLPTLPPSPHNIVQFVCCIWNTVCFFASRNQITALTYSQLY